MHNSIIIYSKNIFYFYFYLRYCLPIDSGYLFLFHKIVDKETTLKLYLL